LRQAFLVKGEASLVMPYICELGEPLTQAEGEKYCGNDPNRYPRIAFFELVQCGATDGGALSQHPCRNASTETRGPDVCTKFAQRAPYRKRHRVLWTF